MDARLPIVASAVSSAIFMSSMLPMLLKAFRTRDVHSYSLSHILLNILGNLIHSLYIFSLPPGPIWVLHAFYLASSLAMLYAWLRYNKLEKHAARKNSTVSLSGGKESKTNRPALKLQYNNCI
jgi:hypothetical protein